MKLFFTILATGVIGNTCLSQTTSEVKGGKQYDNYDYFSAIDNLEDVTVKSADVNRKLALSYDLIGDYATAETYYAAVAQSQNRVPMDILHYARSLMKNQKYEQAELQIQEYKKLNPFDTEADKFRLLQAQIDKLGAKAEQFTISNLDVNSPDEDFSPVVLNGELYFTSSRTEMATVKRTWNGNHLSFLDVYASKIEGKPSVEVKRVSKTINRKYHEGPISFAKNGTEMFITRNNYNGRGKDGSINLKLLMSQKNGEMWEKPTELPFNSNEFSVGHAAASPDGSFVVFVSDMPGGRGGADLYLSRRVDGVWTTPVNLSVLNTVGDEVFPYFHESGLLMFSSNGHPGFGGLDLFAAKWKEGGEIGRMMNVGSPLNTSSDDFSFWMDPEGLSGYFASNRKTGKGDDDIYAFKMEKPFAFGRLIQGIAKDRDGNPMADAKAVIRNENGEIVEETITDENGFYSFVTEETGDLDLILSKKNFFNLRIPMEINENTPDLIETNMAMEVDPGYSMLFSVRDRRTKEVMEDVRIILMNNLSGKQEVVYSDDEGTSLRPILNAKVGDRISYSIRLEKQGYITKVATYNKVLDRPGTYDISEEMNIALEKVAIGVDIATATEIHPIYFDFGKFEIRPDAADELDKIVRIMNENPTMVVELGSHTDCRGSAASNQILSQKRAEASATYIRLRITNPDRIYGKGYGEYKILNGCICEGGKSPHYSEQEHAINRRTEFVIVNY